MKSYCWLWELLSGVLLTSMLEWNLAYGQHRMPVCKSFHQLFTWGGEEPRQFVIYLFNNLQNMVLTSVTCFRNGSNCDWRQRYWNWDSNFFGDDNEVFIFCRWICGDFLIIISKNHCQPFLPEDQLPAFKVVKSVYNIIHKQGWWPIWEKELGNVSQISDWKSEVRLRWGWPGALVCFFSEYSNWRF